MTSRKIVVETTVRKIDIDWDRVYSGFVASGLSLREFRRLHLQCFCLGGYSTVALVTVHAHETHSAATPRPNAASLRPL